MKAAGLLAEIAQAGGTITAIGDRLKFQRVPARLVPAIKENKAELLAELQKVNLVNLVNIDSGYLAPPRIVHDQEPMFTDPEVMAETLLLTMRAIGLRVRLTAQGELRIGPSDMLWPYDRELIEELKPQLVTILKQEQHHD